MRPCPLLDRYKHAPLSQWLSAAAQIIQWQCTHGDNKPCHHAKLFGSCISFRETYLVLVLQPTSCWSWMSAASCWRSATSLPWACLMKGCSRRWVTDGRASKSFIRHLHKHRNDHSVTSPLYFYHRWIHRWNLHTDKSIPHAQTLAGMKSERI